MGKFKNKKRRGPKGGGGGGGNDVWQQGSGKAIVSGPAIRQ